MQAVLLGAGESSRFFPLNLKHKCLTKVAGETIAAHTIRAVKKAGITDIIFVVSNENDFQEELGNGKRFGVKINYVIQNKATGMGDALLLASSFIKSDFFLLNSNHVEFDSLKILVDKIRTNREVILIAKKDESKHFGVLKTEGSRVLAVEEKPRSREGLSNLRVVGVYFLNEEFISVLKKIAKDHYSFEAALDKYAKLGKVRWVETEDRVLSLKYPWDLLDLKDYILLRLGRKVSKKAKIAKTAVIEGNVVIEEGVVVDENAIIKGPAYIGRNVYIGSNTLLRSGADIEEGAKIGAYMEVKNSLVGKGSTTHSGFMGDSIVGSNTKIGALFGTANVRLDRENVKAIVKGEKVDTGRRSLGALIGSNARIGERVSTMPGILIGNGTVVGPSTTVMENLESNVTYYTKFASIVKKNRSVTK